MGGRGPPSLSGEEKDVAEPEEKIEWKVSRPLKENLLDAFGGPTLQNLLCKGEEDRLENRHGRRL